MYDGAKKQALRQNSWQCTSFFVSPLLPVLPRMGESQRGAAGLNENHPAWGL